MIGVRKAHLLDFSEILLFLLLKIKVLTTSDDAQDHRQNGTVDEPLTDHFSQTQTAINPISNSNCISTTTVQVLSRTVDPLLDLLLLTNSEQQIQKLQNMQAV